MCQACKVFSKKVLRKMKKMGIRLHEKTVKRGKK